MLFGSDSIPSFLLTAHSEWKAVSMHILRTIPKRPLLLLLPKSVAVRDSPHRKTQNEQWNHFRLLCMRIAFGQILRLGRRDAHSRFWNILCNNLPFADEGEFVFFLRSFDWKVQQTETNILFYYFFDALRFSFCCHHVIGFLFSSSSVAVAPSLCHFSLVDLSCIQR